MKVEEAIDQRYSVRAFLDQPVAKRDIEAILRQAVRAPSWGNTQPWEIAVAGGDVAKAVTDEFCQLLGNGVQMNPDFNMPVSFTGLYNDRYRSVGKEVFRLKGIGREDQDARAAHYMSNFRAFGAPVLIYLLQDQCLDTVYPVFGAGSLAQNICLLATSRGMGTCLLAALAWYPDVIRKHLGLGTDKKVVLGIGLGYPDPADPVNTLRSERADLKDNVRFVGMD